MRDAPRTDDTGELAWRKDKLWGLGITQPPQCERLRDVDSNHG